MKTRNKLKITSLLLAIVMVLSMLPMLSLTALAATAKLTVDITGADGTTKSVTLQDADGDGFYDIGTADELYAFAAAVNGGNGTINGELTADIVVNDNVLDENGELNDDSNFREWTPIGLYVDSYDAATVFHGQFNGNNHTVSGLYFNDENHEYVGLFGYTNGAAIIGIGVLDCYISGKRHVGGVVGHLRTGTLENCYNTGSVHGVFNVGGVAGWAGNSSTVQNCFNSGNVSGDDRIGGVVGYIYDVNDTTTLKNCYSTGKIVGVSNVRGVIGYVINNTVENCFFLENTVTMNETVGNGSDVSAGTQAVGLAQFVSGEVAYKLGFAFGQTLEGENRQSYPVLGGTPVTDSKRFEIYGQQLNLGGDLSMKYYVTAYAPDFDPEQLQMQFIHNGVVTTPKYEIVDGFYVFTLDGINPQCMGDRIDAYLYHGEVKKTEKLSYTVEENLNNLLKKYPDDTALVTLVNDLLAYGTASEKYKEHQSMAGNYTVGEVTSVEYPSTKHTDNSGTVELMNVNVRFGTMNYLVFRFTGDGLSADSIFKIDGEAPAEIYMESENVLVVVSQPISPYDFHDNVLLHYYEGESILIEIEYSINAYCDTIIAGSGFTDAMTSLAKALYNYGVSAELYAHVVNGVGEHTYIYTDNCDGTHSPVCQYCGFVNDAEAEVHTFENGKCVCGKYEVTLDLSTLNATYVINDNRYYEFIGSGSYGIKVESGNPGIVLNNASITVGEGSAIDVASGSNATIFVLGDNTIGTTKSGYPDVPCGGIFVAEGGTVNITSNGTDNILRAHGTLAAAIGGKYIYGGDSYNAGSISISNVTVYAYTNNYYAAAIGAAGVGTCGTINITNAVVYAYGAGDNWTSAPGIGSAWGSGGWSETIPVVIISDSEVHTFRYNSYSDYIGYLGDEFGEEGGYHATSSINCGEGGSVKSSTIYCYTGLDATTTDKVVIYDADGNPTENQN